MQITSEVGQQSSGALLADRRGTLESTPDMIKMKAVDSLKAFINTCPKSSDMLPLKRKLTEFSSLLDSKHAREAGYLKALLKQLSAETHQLTEVDQNQAEWDAASRRPDRIAPHRFKSEVRNKIDELLAEASSLKC